MSSTRDLDVIRHILRHCGNIAASRARFGDDFEIFANDLDYYSSVAMGIFQIGELTGHLSDDFKMTYPGVPWHQIKGLRNVVAHRYEQIDTEILWNTVQERVPELADYCNIILAERQS